MVLTFRILTVILLFSYVYSWSCNVHKLTIEMIRPYLSAKEEKTLLNLLNQSTIVKSELSHIDHISDPVCLPDSIKRRKQYRSTAVWHYLDIDYDPNNNDPISEEYFSPYEDNLYTMLIEQYFIFLESTEIGEKGDALLFLLHLLGDATQPFHVIQLRSDEYPDGDKGGLKYTLFKSSFKNLHLLTDNVANYFKKSDFKQPELAVQLNQYCDEKGLRGNSYHLDIEDMVEDWLVETHNRGIQIYEILGGRHRVSGESKERIQQVLLEGICRSTTILLEVLHDLLWSCLKNEMQYEFSFIH